MDKEVKKVFTPKPMILFRSARKLSNYLLRPKMYPMPEMLGQRIVIVNAVKFLKTLMRHLLEPAHSLERSLLLTTSFTVTLDVS